MEPRIETLSAKLQELREADRKFVVFGASEHRYRTTPWSQPDIDRLSQKAGEDLPEELTLWLLNVGSGAGPDYGLALELDDTPVQRPVDGDLQGDFEQLIDVRVEDMQGLINEALSQPPDGKGFHAIPAVKTRAEVGGSGILSLGFAGCSFDYVMPLCGDLKGKIFYRDGEAVDENGVECGGLLWPQGFCKLHPSYRIGADVSPTYQRNASELFGLFDWIEDWLDTSLYLVEHHDAHQHYQEKLCEEFLGQFEKPPGRIQRWLQRFLP